MLRSFFLPIVLISLIGIPMLYSHHQASMQQQSPFLNGSYNADGSFNPNNGYDNGGAYNSNGFYPPASQNQFGNQNSTIFGGVSYPSNGTQFGNPPVFKPNNGMNQPAQLPPNQTMGRANPIGNQNLQRNNVIGQAGSANIPTSPQTNNYQAGYAPNKAISSTQPDPTSFSPVVRPNSNNPIIPAGPGASSTFTGPPVTAPVPDFGRAETLVFPGDANGPDLSAKPMSFVPVSDFRELFRFNISPDWVKSRWDRVSTNPGAQGLHGLRTSLVTGTNTWDLHGSLTYYFDVNHQIQRITFRGWTGDANRLLQLLSSQYQFQPQQTHWAGFFLSDRKGNTAKSGMLMQHPTVIRKDNPVQKLAIILELNNPQSKILLSEEFISLTPAAQTN